MSQLNENKNVILCLPHGVEDQNNLNKNKNILIYVYAYILFINIVPLKTASPSAAHKQNICTENKWTPIEEMLKVCLKLSFKSCIDLLFLESARPSRIHNYSWICYIVFCSE